MEYPRKHSGNSLHKFKIKAATLTGNGSENMISALNTLLMLTHF